MTAKFKESISTGFSHAAATYDGAAIIQKQIAQTLAKMAKKYIPEKAKIIDLGSGTGFVQQALAQPVLQVDIAFQMAKRSFRNSHAINADIEALPIKSNSVDIAFSSSTLQWLPNFQKTFNEVSRVLKQGDYLCFSIFADGTLTELKNSFTNSSLHSKILSFPVQSKIQGALETHGFKIVSTETEVKKTEHKNLLLLLKSLREIGATASQKNTNLTKQNLSKVESYYRQHYSPKQNLTCSWNVIYFIAQKK